MLVQPVQKKLGTNFFWGCMVLTCWLFALFSIAEAKVSICVFNCFRLSEESSWWVFWISGSLALSVPNTSSLTISSISKSFDLEKLDKSENRRDCCSSSTIIELNRPKLLRLRFITLGARDAMSQDNLVLGVFDSLKKIGSILRLPPIPTESRSGGNPTSMLPRRSMIGLFIREVGSRPPKKEPRFRWGACEKNVCCSCLIALSMLSWPRSCRCDDNKFRKASSLFKSRGAILLVMRAWYSNERTFLPCWLDLSSRVWCSCCPCCYICERLRLLPMAGCWRLLFRRRRDPLLFFHFVAILCRLRIGPRKNRIFQRNRIITFKARHH